jgi:hypothetical protein
MAELRVKAREGISNLAFDEPLCLLMTVLVDLLLPYVMVGQNTLFEFLDRASKRVDVDKAKKWYANSAC